MMVYQQYFRRFCVFGFMLLQVFLAGSVMADQKVAGREITALDLIELKELSGMAGNGLTVSPDGNYAAFELHQANVGTDSYHVDWYILSLKPGGQVTRIADGGDPLLFRNGYGGAVNGDWGPKEAKWSPDSKDVAYLRQERGAVQIWRSSLKGVHPTQMTKNAADVEDFFWSGDGGKIYFRTDAARTVIKDAEQQRAAKGYRVEENFIPAYPSRLRIGAPYELLGGEPEIWVLDVKTGREQKAKLKERKIFAKLAGEMPLPSRPAASRVRYAPNKRDVAWLENNAPQKNPGIDPPLTLFSSGITENSKEIMCAAPECTGWFDSLWWRKEGDEVIFKKREGLQLSHRTLYAWNRTSGKVRRIYSTSDWLSGCVMTDHRAICYLETPTKPRRIISIDLDQGALKELYNPNPDFDEIRLGEVERLEWTNANGVGTWGYLVKPRDYQPGKRYPLIIIQYRPRLCLRGGVGDEYPTHLFSAHGFVVLCFNQPENYDIFAQSKDAYDAWKREWTDNIRQRQILSSLESIIDLLNKQGLIDPTRVGLTGLSAGSEAVQYAVVNSNAFAAAAFSSPAFEPILYDTLSDKLREHLLKPAGFGRPGTDAGYNWHAMSLSMNAERITTPLLIQASDHEYISALQSLISLRDAGKPVDMYVFPGEYHIKWSPRHRFYIYQRNIDWFNFWLKGVKDNDPAKARQYDHWQVMREGKHFSAPPIGTENLKE